MFPSLFVLFFCAVISSSSLAEMQNLFISDLHSSKISKFVKMKKAV